MSSQKGHSTKCMYYKDSLSNGRMSKSQNLEDLGIRLNDLCSFETWWYNKHMV